MQTPPMKIPSPDQLEMEGWNTLVYKSGIYAFKAGVEWRGCEGPRLCN